MSKKMHSILYATIVLLLEFSIYIALGLYKISVGCSGITVDCYVPESEFAKEMQSIIVICFLLTLVWLAFAIISSMREYLCGYIKSRK